jgi:protein-arginine kinase activator protein McsA
LLKNGDGFMAETEAISRETIMGCPKCQAALREISENDVSRFSCSNGHYYLMDEILPGFEDMLGGLLDSAVKVLVKN